MMEDDLRQFREELGIPPHDKFMIDVEPPDPVNEEDLRAFRRGELTEQEGQRIAATSSCRSPF